MILWALYINVRYKLRSNFQTCEFKDCVNKSRYEIQVETFKKRSKNNPKSIKHGPKIDQKSSKIEVWRAPEQVWRPLGPSWAIQSVFGGILDRLGGVLEASWRGLGGLLGGLGPRKVANMAPTWLPKRSQNRLKIEAKNDLNFDAS
mgnify:CR=1 FL=1